MARPCRAQRPALTDCRGQVLEVVTGSAADKAGVLPGDTIVGVDDNQIGKKASALRRRLSCHSLMRNSHPHPFGIGSTRLVSAAQPLTLRHAPLFSTEAKWERLSGRG